MSVFVVVICVHREVPKDKIEDCIEVEAARSKRKSSNTEQEMVTIKKVCLYVLCD